MGEMWIVGPRPEPDPAEDYRVKFNTKDFNKHRVAKIRMDVSSSRHNIDVQGVVVELVERAKKTAGSYDVSRIISDLIRDGCRYRVEHFPNAATPGMIWIHNKGVRPEDAIAMPSAAEMGLIPLLSEYHKKWIKGKKIGYMFDLKMLSEKDLVDIYFSSATARSEILSRLDMRRIVQRAMLNSPEIRKMICDELEVSADKRVLGLV